MLLRGELKLELPHLITFIEGAMTRDPGPLAALNERLAHRVTRPLFHAARLIRRLETAVVTVWERQQPPSETLDVPPR